ncbi:hypothetical protein SAMD00023353_4800350 [Rosellinia necatrix]|uniref:Uncharacterized protein n=1 Tax=Rosellinia necatrix TaxID=77044 RepID=A0A1W2TQD1_ROSNE|nr:hypothetical protein SAMD00023353_4800350 [Rosellinia necatrix]
MADYMGKREYLDDDDKTLSDVMLNDSSSSHSSKKKLSKAMTHLKAKLKAKEEKPRRKTPIPPDYYPNNRRTFEALAASRM